MDEKKYEENLKLENSSSYKIESLNKFNDMVDEHKEYGK